MVMLLSLRAKAASAGGIHQKSKAGVVKQRACRIGERPHCGKEPCREELRGEDPTRRGTLCAPPWAASFRNLTPDDLSGPLPQGAAPHTRAWFVRLTGVLASASNSERN